MRGSANSPAASSPRPSDMTALTGIVPAAAPEGVDAAVIEKVTAAAFGQRRKMLRSTLKPVPGALDALADLGIDSDRRAETLAVADFVALAKKLS